MAQEIIVATLLFAWGQPTNFPGQPPLLQRLDDAFAAIKRAGFDYVEANTGLAADGRFLDALRRHGLGIASAYSGGTFQAEAEAEQAIAAIVAAASPLETRACG